LFPAKTFSDSRQFQQAPQGCVIAAEAIEREVGQIGET